MTNTSIYRDIATRTGGDIYIGIVGPVRSGKSTLIKRLMDTLVIPNMEDPYGRERATDELPQSAAGRTIMTTEPKFIPEEAVAVRLGDNAAFRVRMIDCVGYIVPSAIGYIEDNMPRMVKTPWYDEPIPFNMAAEIGTKKVITEHSTIGIVVTTDGSITDIPRAEYEEAEERVIRELQEIHKPFVVLLNCVEPQSAQAAALAAELTRRYGTPVLAVNCMQLTEEMISRILSQVLFEFPVRDIRIEMPRWLTALEQEHTLRRAVIQLIRQSAAPLRRIREVSELAETLGRSEYADGARVLKTDLGTGSARIQLRLRPGLFYQVLAEKTGRTLTDESELFQLLVQLSQTEKRYARLRDAMDEVAHSGYGIVMPDTDELELEEPEVTHQGGKYGVRLRARAPSIHLMRADITAEVAPIVGSEQQSTELAERLQQELAENPAKLWSSNIFGKSLNELVNDGLRGKLNRMPDDARQRLRETLEQVLNGGCNALICIIL